MKSQQKKTVRIQDNYEQQQQQDEQHEELDDSFDQKDGYEKVDGEHEYEDEQFGELLAAEEMSKQEMMLKFKVEELQKICNSLSETNRKLIGKITKMQEELE